MAVYKGTAGNDNIVGTETADILYGYDGDDELNGGSGAEIDKLYGGAGDDVFFISGANDGLSDVMDGGTGINSIVAEDVYADISSAFIKNVTKLYCTLDITLRADQLAKFTDLTATNWYDR